MHLSIPVSVQRSIADFRDEILAALTRPPDA
jgi:hypothetical protein